MFAADNGNLMSSFTLNRRSLDRFRRNHKENKVCWDRHPDKDSFFSVIDTHNHFRPFGGPAVEFDTYLKWMQDAGIIFSTMFGIGQLIKKTNEEGKKVVLPFLLRCNRKILENLITYYITIYLICRSRLLLLLTLSYPSAQSSSRPI